MVAAEGWLDTSNVHYLDLAKKMEQIGVKTIIFTDIAKDGMLQGPNVEQLRQLNAAVSSQYYRKRRGFYDRRYSQASG